jgi:hypothetical protein
MRVDEFEPVYVDLMPEKIEEGKLYISKEYKTAIHLCACGCKGKTVTPLGAKEWTLTDTNGTVTLRPSIGNWSNEKPYHAHYFITNNKVDFV